MKKVMAFVLVLTLCLGLCGCSAADQVLKAVDQHEYQKASEVYWDKASGNAEAELAVRQGLMERIADNFEAYNNGKKTEAEAMLLLETIRKADLLDPITIADAVYQIGELRESKDCFAEAQDYQSAGRFEEAYETYQLVIGIDANYDTAMKEAQVCYDSFIKAVCDEAQDHANNGRFAQAVQLLKKYLERYPNDLTLSDACDDTVKDWVQDITDKVNDFVKNGQYPDAYNLLLQGQAELPDPTVLDTVMADLLDKWKVVVKADAETAFGGSAKNYEAAIKTIQASGIPAEVMEEELAHYQSYIPKPLTSLEYTQKQRYIQVGNVSEKDAKDVNGKEYEDSNIIHPDGGSLNTEVSESEDDAYVTYHLNQEYALLTGVLYRPYRSLESESEWETATTVKFYGDGVLLYEGPNFTRDTYDTVPFEIDVTGVRELKIVMRGVWTTGTGWIGMYSRNPKVCAGDLIIRR